VVAAGPPPRPPGRPGEAGGGAVARVARELGVQRGHARRGGGGAGLLSLPLQLEAARLRIGVAASRVDP